MKRKLLLAALCVVGALGMRAQISWTSKTNLINNPSFETDVAAESLTGSAYNTSITGWTFLPTSVENSQVGIANSSTTLSNIGFTTHAASAGDNYFYTRNNWQKNTTFTLSQTITASSDNMPIGLYKLTCKALTYSSNAAFGTLTLGLQEGNKTAVTHDGIVLNVWNTWGVILFKESADSDLKIQVNFKPGYDGGGNHYAMLLDDFQLEYISATDAYTASSTNSIDFSDIINNAGIYNHSTKGTMPRGWTASKHTTGNGNYTEGEKGDTRFEGWSGGNLDIDYNQTITNLPAGTYTVTANAHERAEVSKTYIYAYTDGQEEATGLVNSKTDNDITTSALKVTNGTMKIGIKSTANDWVTADNFRISFLGFDVDAVKADYETSYAAAVAARDNASYINVIGEEKTTLVNTITTYTTTTDQNYGWYVAAKAALDAALDAFTAAKTNYDALVAEIDKATALGMNASSYAATSTTTAATALISTKNLKVVEYTYVTTNYQYAVPLGEWTSTGTNTKAATFSNEHWSGETHEYKNQNDDNGQGWNADSWSIGFSQNVTLPAGNYVFKVAGRQASGDKVNTSLVVKNGDTVLGTVSDFPRSNSSRGINKSGATAFEGGDDDFANGGKGFGWEWRYVKFTLTEGATVNIAINSVATAKYQWVSFGDYTVQTDDETNISRIAYNVALASAQTVIEDLAYANVTGSEKTALQTAIDDALAMENPDKAAIEAATGALNSATTAFTNAKNAYDAFVAAQAITVPNLTYADATKKTDLETALAATANTAAEATTNTSAITTALRLYYESNALAEGVYRAVNKTELISNPNFEGVSISGTSAGAWTFDQTGGSANINDNESFTDGGGNSSYSYYNYYNGSNNNQNLHQTISDLEPGKYLLTVTGRGHSNFNNNLQLYVVGKGSVNIPAIGASGGTFDRGWNDASLVFDQTEKSDITIGVKTNNNQSQWWGATRFRLVKIADIKKSSDELEGYKTFYNADYNYKVDDNTTIYIARVPNSNDKYVTITPVEGKIVPKGNPVILKTGDTKNYTITLTPTEESSSYSFSSNALQVVGANETVNNVYVLGYLAGEGNGLGFYMYEPSLDAGDVYLNVSNTANVRLGIIVDGEATAINSVKAEAGKANEATYNMAGQRVNGSYKGIVIKNGKKYMIK